MPAKASKPKIARSAPAPAKKSPTPSFGFFGQGDANYFEWFEMWISFEKPVATKMREQLLKAAPKLCALDATWPHGNLLWASTGDQWIHQHLIGEYGSEQAQEALQRVLVHQAETGDPWDTGDEDEEAMFAGSKELNQFNSEIETWLHQMHALQPILFVARREDGEAGGTRLGAWHRKSVAAFEIVLRPQIELLAGAKKTKKDMRPSPISIVIDYLGQDKVSAALAKWASED